ncbi:muscarinic acetylcholine receptor M4-like [Diadema antillarum]|uniref:muscarinic acetylcholine receptor M4-like n=1 Tax=Diadema antillarum TaxID=105358 RepID=UPI003A87E136
MGASPTPISFTESYTMFISNATETNEEQMDSRSLAWLIVVGSIYCLIILVTLVGNAFIMTAYKVDEKIRARPGNLLILNLSISDFGIGITLIFNFVFLAGDRWPLGEIPCKLWIVLDYTCSYMSVLSITLISLDRYWMVKKKLAYRTYQTKKRILVTVAICWSIVISFYTITAFGYGAFTKSTHVDFSNDCEMEYLYDVPFSAVMIFVEFVIPFIMIIYLNVIVYINIRMRSGSLVQTGDQHKSNKSLGTDTANGLALASTNSTPAPTLWTVSRFSADTQTHVEENNGVAEMESSVAIDVRISHPPEEEEAHDNPSNSVNMNVEQHVCQNEMNDEKRHEVLPDAVPTDDGNVSCGNNDDNENAVEQKVEQNGKDLQASGGPGKNGSDVEGEMPRKAGFEGAIGSLSISTLTVNSVAVSVGSNSARLPFVSRDKERKKLREFRRHHKAATLLFVLVTAFCLCWLPYQITTIIMTTMGDESVPEVVSEIMTNLLWCNSTINPFLYAVVTAHFRRNFLRFLGLQDVTCCYKHNQTKSSSSDDHEKVSSSDPYTVDN